VISEAETLSPAPRRPAKHVSIGRRDLSLVYNMRAVLLYKQKTGDNLFSGAALHSIGPASDPERFLWCLWAGLQSQQPDVTRDFLEENVNFAEASDLLKSIVAAIADDFPEARPANPPEPETAPATPPETKVLEATAIEATIS
jgi:hypothetical protein